MKTNKVKKENKKFDLDKMNFAKLKSMHLVKGGGGDPETGTATSSRCQKKQVD